jgi:cellulose synthase/poly-beta-1,6-N-acetylglucosamine synthase-like glycosyltransferase
MELFTAVIILITIYTYALATISAYASLTDGATPPVNDPFGALFFVLLVPVLNEEQVIGRTLLSLLALSDNLLVLVIDDASDDGTIAKVLSFQSDHRVRLLSRSAEHARRGKGSSLNAGYAEVRRWRLVEQCGADNLIIGVFDGDARVDPNFLQSIAWAFRDPRTAGVQAAVRMYNASHNLLTLWQHLEFVFWGEIYCRAKNRLGSATLGGNGQFVRFSALENLGPEPWQASSLTEDLDLSLRMLMKGWRLQFCPSVAVRQEAVSNLRRLVRQRSRWLQGHLVCWQYLPRMLHSPLPLVTRLDLIAYLLLPALVLPVGLMSIGSWVDFLMHVDRLEGGLILLWYVLAFGMVPLTIGAWKQTGRSTNWTAVVHGHLFVLYSVVWFLACATAFWSVMTGRRAWAKTVRLAQDRQHAARSGPRHHLKLPPRYDLELEHARIEERTRSRVVELDSVYRNGVFQPNRRQPLGLIDDPTTSVGADYLTSNESESRPSN